MIDLTIIQAADLFASGELAGAIVGQENIKTTNPTDLAASKYSFASEIGIVISDSTIHSSPFGVFAEKMASLWFC